MLPSPARAIRPRRGSRRRKWLRVGRIREVDRIQEAAQSSSVRREIKRHAVRGEIALVTEGALQRNGRIAAGR